jgi:hypothetical protein
MEILGFPKKHLQNILRMDGIQYLPLYLCIPLPYGLQKFGIPSGNSFSVAWIKYL